MPIIYIGNYITNVDKDSEIQRTLNKINNKYPKEIVVICREYKKGLIKKKTIKKFDIYHKINDVESEYLIGGLTEKEAECWLDGLHIGMNNPARKFEVFK